MPADDCTCLGMSRGLQHGHGEYVVWRVIFFNVAWVLLEWHVGGRDALDIFDNVIPPMMCFPMMVELGLRLIYEPGHKGTEWSPTERDSKKDEARSAAWQLLQGWICFPCQTVCPCFTVTACGMLSVGLDLALCRTPLVAIDSVAVVSFVIDRWVLAGITNMDTKLQFSLCHTFSSGMQLLRLFRPWAVGTREQNWPPSCRGGALGEMFAIWLTTDPNELTGVAADDIERQHMVAKAETTRAPGAFGSSPLLNSW